MTTLLANSWQLCRPVTYEKDINSTFVMPLQVVSSSELVPYRAREPGESQGWHPLPCPTACTLSTPKPPPPQPPSIHMSKEDWGQAAERPKMRSPQKKKETKTPPSTSLPFKSGSITSEMTSFYVSWKTRDGFISLSDTVWLNTPANNWA